MSHQSGFRHGGHDFTHRQPPRSRRGGPGSRPTDQALDRRFREQQQRSKQEDLERESPEEE